MGPVSRATSLALVSLALATSTHGLSAQERPAAAQLAPTAHAALPASPAHYWLIPETTPRANDPGLRLAKGAALIAQGDYLAGLPLVTHAEITKTPLAGYAQYYAGIAQHELDRLADADATLTALVKQDPPGHLKE